MKLGYEWGYLYVALCPFTADAFAMFFTHLDKTCFAHFLNQFEDHLQMKGIKKVLLIGDGASAHTAQDWQKFNTSWKRLPTACPELNPVERFFEELRRHTSNRIFDTKEQVEFLLKDLVKDYIAQHEQLKNITLFPYIKQSA